MDTGGFAVRYGVSLPGWVLAELAGEPELLTTLDDRMRVVNRLAARNVAEGGGGPFAALVVERDSGRVLSAGVNQVLASGISAAHAEMVAIGLAQARAGRWDLGDPAAPATELVVNWRPCVQCYGGILWSGVTHLVTSQGPELEELTGFDEGPMVPDWIEQFRDRGIEVTLGVGREEALTVFGDFAHRVASGRAVVYNARGTGTNLRLRP